MQVLDLPGPTGAAAIRARGGTLWIQRIPGTFGLPFRLWRGSASCTNRGPTVWAILVVFNMEREPLSMSLRNRAGGWAYYGQERPPFAVAPGPGQESVWDYPRPPRIDADAREVIVRVSGIVVARTRRALRVLETASPPTFYIPRSDVATGCLQPAPGASYCEWKGTASYWSVSAASVVLDAVGWSYENPLPGFDALRGHLSFYPARIECSVDGIPVKGQPGGFYGGWITPEVVGPFKGGPSSSRW
jgi:uncharacterized protein (DUF427 family)